MNSYLNEQGVEIYNEIKKHCEQKLKWLAIDSFELTMLANSFALYAECARVCNENGVSIVFQPKNGKPMPYDEDDEDLALDEKRVKNEKQGGVYMQIRPEYTVMKTEYANILKHSAKFGLNSSDRDKILKNVKEDGKKKGFDLTGGKMKIAN